MWAGGAVGGNESEDMEVVWSREEKRGGEALSRVHYWQVQGRRPRRKRKKSWMIMIQEDMRKLGINEDLTSDLVFGERPSTV